MRKGWQRVVHRTKGFTVVELLIVIVVIAILAAIVVVSYRGVVDSSREAVAQANVEQVAKKLLVYFQKNRTYPTEIRSMGFKDTDDVSYIYNHDSASTYCASVTSGEKTYHITDSIFAAQEGECPAAPLPTPLAAWLFDEGSGSTAADSSGNGYSLTATGNPWTASGHSGAGYVPVSSKYFSRSSGFGSGTLETWTVTLWYMRTGNTTAGWGQFLHDGNAFWMETTKAGNWGFGEEFSDEVLPLNEWHHLAWVRTSDGIINCYIDGQFSHSITEEGTNGRLKRNSSWKVGTGGDGPLKGTLDSVRIYSTALLQSQVREDKEL